MTWEEDIKLLEENGWEVECQSPFEIRTKDGSFASNEAAQYVLDGLKRDQENDSEEEAVPCWVMQRTKDNLTFVTIDEEYANKLYKSGEYTMLNTSLDYEKIKEKLKEFLEADKKVSAGYEGVIAQQEKLINHQNEMIESLQRKLGSLGY